ncbi:MAG: STAS/SEC14 domain-containing protein [Pseudomonadales bacterium]|nr:STAS/SEC14 domain-containing protein [Pseudomonadales bacterium]
MAWHYKTDSTRGLIIRKIEGAFTDADAIAAWEAYKQLPGKDRYNELYDYLDTTSYDISADVVRRLAHDAQESPDDWHFDGKKTAYVANSGLIWGMLRMFVSMEACEEREIRFFDNREEAMAWLTGDEPDTVDLPRTYQAQRMAS